MDIPILLEFLVSKHASFHTRPLHVAFHILFELLYTVDKEMFLSTIMHELDIFVNTVSQKTNAGSSYVTLLGWVNHVLLLSSRRHEDFLKYHPDLARWQAVLLYQCLAKGNKKGLRVSAICNTRACLRGIFKQKESIWNESAVEDFIKVLTGSRVTPFAACVLLGVVAGVCKRLKHPNPSKVIESSKTIFYDFFIKEIVGSKVRIQACVMVMFRA